MKTLRIIGKIFGNRYVLASLAFAVWMMFFDNNSFRRQGVLNERIGEIKRMKTYYQEEIAKNEAAIDELLNNRESLERFAREKYLMKRDSEDVYIVVRDPVN